MERFFHFLQRVPYKKETKNPENLKVSEVFIRFLLIVHFEEINKEPRESKTYKGVGALILLSVQISILIFSMKLPFITKSFFLPNNWLDFEKILL